MAKCKLVSTPLERNLKVDDHFDTKECEPTHYRLQVGILIYLTITHPDLSYPIGLLSQFMQTPKHIHLAFDKQVLRYASGTMDYSILYNWATLIRLEGYTNVD